MNASTHPSFRAPFSVIAYRGGAGEGVENTLAAIRNTASVNANIILELDVRFSADAVPVVFHDARLKRMTGARGVVGHTQWRRLSRLRLPSGAGIPSLAEVLAAVDSPLLLDVRADSPHRCDALARILASEWSRVALVSEQESTLCAMLQRCPDVLFGASRQRAWGCLLQLPWAKRAPLWMIPPRLGPFDLVKPFRQRCRADERIWAWTVDQPEQAHALRKRGVNGIFTAYPSRFAEWLAPGSALWSF